MATTVAQHTVATFTSPVNGTTPIDANTVRGNDNTIRSSYNDHDSDPGIHVQSSTLASRPAAGTAGRKWITADAGEYKLWYDDGTRWNEVGNDAVDVSFIADGNIVKGDVLKLTGWNNGQNLPTLGPATVSGDVCFAIATETVTNGDRSFAINTGFLEDVNTSAFSTGDILYPSNAAGPGTITSWFQNTKPTSGNYQMAAYVIRDNASNGVLFVEFTGPRIVERSDNTASTVVLRDASGNFSAGTVTVGALTSTGLVTFASLKGTGATTVTNILDEDNMASDSATALATQQSIKAYVDSQVGTVDTLAEILANGNTSGGTNLIMSAGDTLTVDTIAETTAGAGVTIDSVLLKDDVVNATDVETGTVSANDGTLAITVANSTGALTLASALADSNLATISSAGKVANSATTADSANTASAIVARDGSGNFSAGTITAALTGNASTATALSSSRTFALTGDVTGSVSSDLTSGASISTSIAAGAIVDADINAGAAISLSKLATGALPTGITVASANIVDGTIVDADISGSAAIGLSKLATGALPTGITVASANIVDGTIVDADISASAEIAVSKLADGSARQLLQTDAAGTGVEWTSNVDVPGTLDVTGATTLDSTLTVTGDTNIGSGALFVDVSEDNLGVGTANPQPILSEFSGAARGIAIENAYPFIAFSDTTSSAYKAQMGYTGGNLVFFNKAPSGPIAFGTNNQERMRIDSSGNVGIGTTGPSALLDVRLNTTNPVAYFGFSQTNSASNGIVKLQSGRIPQSGSDFTGESGLIFAHSGGAGGTNFDANGGYIKSIRTGLHDVTSSANSALTFATTNANTDTERMRITSDGYLRMASGSGGIQFSGDTAAANALDDYEEGDWTPTYIVSGGTITANVNTSGRYVKIGRAVFIWGYISYESHTGTPTGQIAVGGLPFAASLGYGQQNSGSVSVDFAGLWTSNHPTVGYIIQAATSQFYMARTGTTGFTAVNFSDMTTASNNSQCGFFGKYQIS
jgi:hypothetical protein